MTPLQIRILLHHYYTPLAWDEPSPAADEEIGYFAAQGLLADRQAGKEGYSRYEITPRGTAFVLALMAVPLPVAAWRLPGSDTVIL